MTLGDPGHSGTDRTVVSNTVLPVSPAMNAINEFERRVDPTEGVLVAYPLVSLMDSGREDAHLWPLVREDADHWIYVSAFAANYPGHGAGARMMDLLCEVCDRAGVTILLNASAYGQGLSQEALVHFYERCGFERLAALADHLETPMVRDPDA